MSETESPMTTQATSDRCAAVVVVDVIGPTVNAAANGPLQSKTENDIEASWIILSWKPFTVPVTPE